MTAGHQPRPGGGGDRGAGYPENGYPGGGHWDDPYPEAGRWENGYRETGHPENRYREAGYRDAGRRDASRRDASRRESGHRENGPRQAGRRAPGRGTGYRDPGYGRAGQQPSGYREGGSRDIGRRDIGRRDIGRRETGPWEASFPGAATRESGRRSAGLREAAPRPGHRGGYGAHGQQGPAGGPGRVHGRARPRRRDTTGGADGNERLTAITGSVLLVLLAVEGFTILSIHRLLTLHFFVGMLIAGPVLLKAGSTGYRFARYYTGDPSYRRKGPPAPLLRLLGPFVLVLSMTVIGSGIMLAVVGPAGGGFWFFVHRASFVLWFLVMTVHVLAYVWRLPGLLGAELATRAGARAGEILAGRSARWLLLLASVLTGLMLAVITVHLAGGWAVFQGG